MKKLIFLLLLLFCKLSLADNGMDTVPDHEQLVETLKSCKMLKIDYTTDKVVSDQIVQDVCRTNNSYCLSEKSCFDGYKQFRGDQTDYRGQIFYKCKLDFSALTAEVLDQFDFSNSIFYKVTIILPDKVNKNTLQLNKTNHLCSCQVGIDKKNKNTAINLNKESGTMCTYFKNEKEFNRFVSSVFNYIKKIPVFSGQVGETVKDCVSRK